MARIRQRKMCEKDRRWLQRLRPELWSVTRDEFRETTHYWPKRKLERSEFRKIVDLIRTNQLPCEIHPSLYGDVALTIYDHPAKVGARPKLLLSFTLEHLPFKKLRMTFVTQLRTAQRLFGPLVMNRENLGLLKQ